MDFNTFFNIAITTGIGVIAFFLKYCFSKLNSRASREELTELKEKIEHADEKYASKAELNDLKKQIDKIESNIDFLKENAVRNAEFVRMMSRLEAMIDGLKKE